MSAEDNGDAFCPRFRHDAPLRIGGRTSERFIVVIDHRTETFPKIIFLRISGVSNRLRFRERGFDVFALVEFPFFKTRRESLEMRFGRYAFGLAEHRRRVESAAERDAERNIAAQANLNGAVK